MALDDVRKRNQVVLALTAVMSLVIIVLGLSAGEPRTQIFYVLVGIPLLAAAIIGFARCSAAQEERRLGTVGIQHHWITLSVSLAYLSLVPAEFFATSLVVKVVAGIVALILILASGILLVYNRSSTGVDLSI